MSSSFLMRWRLTLSFTILAIAAVAYRLQQPLTSSSNTHASSSPPETYCYKNVRTHDPDNPSAQCFSVQDGVFTDIGPVPDEAEVEVQDGYVIPGLWDGHGHLLQYGEFLGSVDLFGAETLDEVRARLKVYLKANPGVGTKDRWIRGVGWDQTFFGRMPTAEDIEQDESLKGVYMMLDRIDVHCTWVSNPILALLPSTIPSIPGGEVIRDPGMGVFCDNAMDLVMDAWPRPSRDEKAAQVRDAMRALNAVGLVGMHDAGATPETLRLYDEMAGGADWTLRVYGMLECAQRNTFCPKEAVKFDHEDGFFTVRSVKLFADGALGSWGSAMLEPYSDHPSSTGSMLIPPEDLTTVTTSWAAAGYQVNIHAIGDRANRAAITALETALAQECPSLSLAACQSRRRFRIEHAQIIHPADQARLLTTGIIPSIQPTHATSDMLYALSRLGTTRLTSSAYRMRSLLPAHPVLGSDFPVEPPAPLHGIYAAVARKSPRTGKPPGEGWHAEEALTLDQALWGFTGAPAYGAFLEGRAGVIQGGAFADWVVLDQPLEEGMDVEELGTMSVRETWVGGKRVYARE